MAGFAILLIAFAAALVVWALHTVTVYALPCLSGLGVATIASDAGANLVGSSIVGFGGAIGTFVTLRFLLAHVRSGRTRLIIGSVFVLPSLILGYNIGIDALQHIVSSERWRQAISAAYALFAGWVAFDRLTKKGPQDD